MAADDLAISCRVSTPSGLLELEDEVTGYELHSDTLAQVTSPVRATLADGTWVDGSYALRSTRGNVQEMIAVWITGTSQYDFAVKRNAVRKAFNQLNYQITWIIEDLQEVWTCPQPAELSEQYDQAYRFATTGLIRATVYRLPAVDISQVVAP